MDRGRIQKFSPLLKWALASLIWIASGCSPNATRPTALIYNGSGVCKGCDTSLSKACRQAGFQTFGISPGQINAETLKQASFFAVPGGEQELDVMNALLPGEAKAIKKYVENGGHYLGVCLGAFLAAPKIINTPAPTPELPAGLGLFRGQVFNHSASKEARIEPIVWHPSTPSARTRMMYFQDGPHFKVDDPSATIWARYQDGTIAAFQAPLGQGSIGLIGPHPEADEDWWNEDPKHPLHDSDGQDTDLFIEFVRKMTTFTS